MEFNNDNYGQGEQQLRKRKFNELVNDGQPAAEEGEQKQHQRPEQLSKKKCEQQQGNDDFENLHLESLSREDLIQLVQKQLANQNEAHNKQLEAVNNEAEECANAKQLEASREMATKMNDLKMALLASQQSVEELTVEIAQLRVEHHKHLEELSQQIVQLQQEKGIKESQLPIHRQMIVQLAKETWFDLLAFVPRHQLGQIVPQIGDRQFARIVQPFLHNYAQITLGNIEINRPVADEYPTATGRPQLQLWPKYANWNDEPWYTLSPQMILPDVPISENIRDFHHISILYLDTSILYFLRTLYQKSLFRDVNLDLHSNISIEAMADTLPYVLPLMGSINSIRAFHITHLRDLYYANFEMAMDMLKMARILCIFYYNYEFEPEEVELFNRWLYVPRADKQPRVLIFPSDYELDYRPSKFLHFIDGSIKLEFSTAKRPCSFFFRLFVRDDLEWHHDVCMNNAETKEKLVIKIKRVEMRGKARKMALISRYPLGAGNKWIDKQSRSIYLGNIHLGI